MADGQFDELPGSGKPLPGRGVADPPGWWAQRLLEQETRRRLTTNQRARLEAELGSVWMIEDEGSARAAIEALGRSLSEVDAGLPLEERLTALDLEQMMSDWKAMAAARRRR
jgi:hypothetical protein